MKLHLTLGFCLGMVFLSARSTFGADGDLKFLHGHIPKAISSLQPKGDLPVTNRLNLAIGLPLRNTNELEHFLAKVSDPESPNYRHYLTPAEFTARFGPTEADYAAVISFVQTNHLSLNHTHDNRLLLDVSGSVKDIQNALHLHLQLYPHPTEARDFYAPDTEPFVDSSLPISDISGLNNFAPPRPKNLHRDTRASNAVPRSGSASDGGYLGNDFRAAYMPGVTLTGSGQQLGLLEFDGFYASDITAYESAAGISAVPLQTVLLDGYSGTPTTGSDSGNPEVSLDIEVALAMAPGLSKIVLFEAGPSGSQNDILNAMAASNQIKSFSCSWGWSGGPSTTTDNIFKQMATQGQSFFNASGDSDAFTTGASSTNGVDNTSLDNAPSSSPYITQVGGTTLTTTGPGGSWSSETAWNWGLTDGSYVGTSGGISSYYAIPSWQAGVSMANNGGSTIYRNIPDVALTADNVYVVYGNGSSGIYGGTSCAAPLWAAVATLMNQQAIAAGQSPVGFINPAIYKLATNGAYTSDFHDITTGNNVSSSSPNGFYAVTGYDLCTGLGTPNGQSLITALTGPPDSLGVTPAVGFNASGPIGGPFTSSTQTFVLTNSGSSALSWSLSLFANWLTASATSGILTGYGTTSVTISLSANSTSLAAGLYNATSTFSNLTTQVSQTETFVLQVGQSLVQNGGFETGDLTDWTLVGNTVVRGRHGTSTVYNAVESSSSGYTVVHSGTYGVVLGDTQLATLSQTLSTTAGQTYLISLWLENIAAGSVEQFNVNWSGTNLYSVSNPPAFAWTNLLFLATAASSSAVLQFAAENDPSYFGLDDVSVTQVPSVAFQTARKSANSFNLTWNTASNLVYQVQYKTNILQTNWFNLGNSIAGTGSAVSLSDTNGIAASAQRFYRLVAAP